MNRAPELTIICRRINISTGTFYDWCSKDSGLEVNAAKHLRELEAENGKLKGLLADKLLEVEALRDVVSPRYPLRGEKVAKPSGKKQAANYLIKHHKVSERSACQLVGAKQIHISL